MAKATVTCTCCECGKSFAASRILASRDQANSWEEWAKSNIIQCDECRSKEREAEKQAENKKAAESAKEFELPELTGTEKQVAWANTIRVAYFKNYTAAVAKYTTIIESKREQCEEEFKAFSEVADHLFETKTAASFWIENRDLTIRLVVHEHEKEFTKYEEKTEVQEVVTDYAVKPENSTTDAIAEVKFSNSVLTVSFPSKNDALIKVCKEIGMKWNSKDLVWERKLSEMTGTTDRIIEIGHKLLKAGIPVAIADENIRNKAVKGEYEDECLLWVMNGPDDKLRISWSDGDWYEKSKRITGAKWSSEKRNMMVPVSSFEEIRDFAECNNFKVTTLAKEKMDDYEAEFNKTKQVTVSEHVEVEKPDKLKEILKSSDDIPSDLLDD